MPSNLAVLYHAKCDRKENEARQYPPGSVQRLHALEDARAYRTVAETLGHMSWNFSPSKQSDKL